MEIVSEDTQALSDIDQRRGADPWGAPAFKVHKREIAGRFPGGRATCRVVDQDGEWLKFIAPNGRSGWAKPIDGIYSERDKPTSP